MYFFGRWCKPDDVVPVARQFLGREEQGKSELSHHIYYILFPMSISFLSHVHNTHETRGTQAHNKQNE